MGNSQSQGGARGLHAPQLQQGQHAGVRPGGPPIRWPRMEPPIQVLPQLPPPMVLRNTPNGAILQQGGTISSRPQGIPHGGRRARSSSAHRPPNPESPDLARCGSEPDLRVQMNQQRDPRDPRHHHMTRGRKKYRAPPAPQPGSGVDSSSPDLNGWDGAPRKARLFKTRAETSRRPQEEDMHRRLVQTLSLPRPDIREDKAWPEREETRRSRTDVRDENSQRRPESREEARRHSRPESREDHKRPSRRFSGDGAGEPGPGGRKESRDQIIWSRREDGLSLPRVDGRDGRRPNFEEESALHRSRSIDALSAKNLSSPEFQAELVEAAQKIRPRSALLARHINNRNSPSPEVPIQQHVQDLTKENTQPAKTFYFGMEESNKTVVKHVNSNVNKTNREHRLTAVERSKNIINKRHKTIDPEVDEAVLETFAANFQKNRQQHSVSGTSSLGSDPDPDEVDGGIALQLRPTLPKKQLEIPRFSPTAAWRLLSSVDVSPAASPDSGRGILEDRIPAPDCVQLSLDKSGDSGISGDASPGGCHESSSELIDPPPKTIHYSHHHQTQKSLLLAWTPEQDLEESSSEEEPPLHSKLAAAPGAKLTTRGQLFSTLPRERIDDVSPDAGAHFNSLRRPTVLPCHPSDSNWLLSRSVPGSLNNGHATLLRTSSSPSSPEQFVDEPTSMTKYPSYSYLAQGGHVVYLPEYKSRCSPENRGMSLNYHELTTSSPSFLPDLGITSHNLSRSCENVCADMQETEEAWPARNINNNRCFTEQRPNKKKKFTFQSTVRLIENKRLAEKLSKEAELKENQRLGELDAMRRVEEEFQRKRAREKANIRHQLRLFSLEEKEYTSLPPLDWGRPEPDGAPTSLPPQPRAAPGAGAATQVLSEFRETTRDYRDYTHSSSRHSPDIVEVPPRKNIVKHPRIVADIPKNLPVYVSAQPSSVIASPRPRDNYRKEFAHGTLAAGRTNSSDSDSQPRTRPGSRQTGSRTRSGSNDETDSRSRSASPIIDNSNSPTLQASRSKSSSSISRSPTPQRQQSPSPEPLVQPWSARKSLKDRQRKSSSPISSRSVSKSPMLGRRSRSNSPGRDKKISSASDEPRSRSVTPISGKTQPGVAVPQQRVLLSAVQPFNKVGKSYRPINFTPRKLAQIVT